MTRWPLLWRTLVIVLLVSGRLIAQGQWCYECVDNLTDWCREGHPGGDRSPLDADQYLQHLGDFGGAGEGEF